MLRKLSPIFVILVLLALTTTTVFAAVTFNPENGTGFVGKGDVQIAFGWNNAQLQNYATAVTFTYITNDTYTVTETWATGNPNKPVSLNSHEITVTKTRFVNGVVDNDPRQVKGQKQFTGFILKGWLGSPIVGGDTIPSVDVINYVTYTWTDNQGVEHITDLMPVDAGGNLYTEGFKKAVVSVELTSSEGGLYANWNGLSRLLQ